jgi:glycogen(starch) synthase
VAHNHYVVLCVVGPRARPEHHKAVAEELDDARHARFRGFIEHERMPPYYAQADLFGAPSRRGSFGVVAAEALACGLPAVATGGGAIPEVVVDRVTAVLVLPDNPAALARD